MKNKDLFLATTALEEFWDTSRSVVFLSDACLRYSRKEIRSNLDYQVFKSPLEDRLEFNKAYNFVDGIYEHILIILSDSLNSIHNIKASNKFWRIFIGPWLMHYIHIMYERYICIETVLNSYPDIATIGLSVDEFVVPRDFSDFFEKVFSDVYNLQIYSKILSLMGKNFPTKKPQTIQPLFEECYRTTKQNKIKRFIKGLFKNFSPIIIKNSYFPSPNVEYELIIKSKNKIFFDHDNSFMLPHLPIDIVIRNKLKDYLKLDIFGSFENMLVKLLPFDIPKVYLEGFNILNQRVRNYPRPKVIATSESWYFDELFKLWAANCSEYSATLVGIQHGSNYGIASIIPHENHEIKITSRFYSWGWEDNGLFPTVMPLPAPRLMNRKAITADNNKQGILFIQNSIPRYFYGFQDFRNYDIPDYFSWQRRFYNAIERDFRKEIKVRLYPVDYGCDCKERWLGLDEAINFDDPAITFLKSLSDCRLSVHDHLANTFLESLVLNKPAIFFWDPNVFAVRSDAQPFFEQLNKSGILYYNPEEAAKAVSSVYSDVESWWLDPVRQKARENICNQFAIYSPNAVNMWTVELLSLLDKDISGPILKKEFKKELVYER